MSVVYQDIIHRIERSHRRFLDVLSVELLRVGIEDVNNVQSLILYNIGGDTLTVGELTARGYYLGSNVSYNLKKLVEHDYVTQERAPHDKRSIRIKLTERGTTLRQRLLDFFARHVNLLGQAGIDSALFDELDRDLAKLEQFWTAQMAFAGMMPATQDSF